MITRRAVPSTRAPPRLPGMVSLMGVGLVGAVTAVGVTVFRTIVTGPVSWASRHRPVMPMSVRQLVDVAKIVGP
jgi:hypothetical protein